MAGAPKGNTNAAKSKRLSSHLLKRLEERDLERKLMDVLLDKALGGDMAAIKEVFDRVDGKSVQPLAGDDDRPLVIVTKVIREIVSANNKDS